MDVMKREVGRGVPQNANSLVEMSLKLARLIHLITYYQTALLGLGNVTKSHESVLAFTELLKSILIIFGVGRGTLAQE